MERLALLGKAVDRRLVFLAHFGDALGDKLLDLLFAVGFARFEVGLFLFEVFEPLRVDASERLDLFFQLDIVAPEFVNLCGRCRAFAIKDPLAVALGVILGKRLGNFGICLVNELEHFEF